MLVRRSTLANSQRVGVPHRVFAGHVEPIVVDETSRTKPLPFGKKTGNFPNPDGSWPEIDGRFHCCFDSRQKHSMVSALAARCQATEIRRRFALERLIGVLGWIAKITTTGASLCSSGTTLKESWRMIVDPGIVPTNRFDRDDEVGRVTGPHNPLYLLEM